MCFVGKCKETMGDAESDEFVCLMQNKELKISIQNPLMVLYFCKAHVIQPVFPLSSLWLDSQSSSKCQNCVFCVYLKTCNVAASLLHVLWESKVDMRIWSKGKLQESCCKISSPAGCLPKITFKRSVTQRLGTLTVGNLGGKFISCNQ